MPYQGAFAVHSEKALGPVVSRLQSAKDRIIAAFDGHENEDGKGDLSFTLYPLPKVPLFYNFFYNLRIFFGDPTQGKESSLTIFLFKQIQQFINVF